MSKGMIIFIVILLLLLWKAPHTVSNAVSGVWNGGVTAVQSFASK